jgi:DNA-binding SARP family transcriptional activator
MRLYELASDRTAALRQYERCVAALDKDLGVKPSERTVRLYEQIRAGRLRLPPPNPAHAGTISEPGESPLPEVLSRLKSFEVVLEDVQQQVRKDIQAVERVLSGSA